MPSSSNEFSSAHTGIESSVEEAWKQETRRRVAEIQSGVAPGICLEVALAGARGRLESAAVRGSKT